MEASRLRRISAIALVAGLAVVACVGSSTLGPRTATLTHAPADASALVDPAGCLVDSPGGTVHDLPATDARGRPRQFDLHVALGYDRHRPASLVFVFHAASGNMADPLGVVFRQVLAEAGDSALLVVPQGLPFQSYGVGWDQSCQGDDMAFYDAMVRAVSRRYCVDPHRIFVTGFSWGADMANAMACCRGDTLRGIAPFSGDETDYNASCPTRHYPATRLRYGTVKGTGGDGGYSLAQFESATRFFRQAQACAKESDPVDPSPCRAYRSCQQPLLECVYPQMGHTTPDAAEVAATWKFWRSLP